MNRLGLLVAVLLLAAGVHAQEYHSAGGSGGGGPVNASALTGTTLASGVTGAPQTWNGLQTFAGGTSQTGIQTTTVAALGAVTADGGVIQNTTPSTAAIPVQVPPKFRLSGTVWNTTSPTTNSDDWWIEAIPTSAAVPTSLFRIQHALNGLIGVAFPMLLTSGGSPTFAGLINTNGGVQLGAASLNVRWAGAGSMRSVASGQFIFGDGGAGPVVGAGFDVTTAGLFKFRTLALTADAGVSAAFYNSTATSTLTITANVIAPTSSLHHVGAGLIKTITVPALCTPTCSISIIPDAAFTYDATGNIRLPSGGGTATIDRLMIFAWDGTAWRPNY